MRSVLQLMRARARVPLPAIGVALLVLANPAQAFKPAFKSGGENTPLSTDSSASSAHTGSSGGSLVRTIVGLLIVIAVIWGLTWILRQVKSGRETRTAGTGLTNIASLPLGSGRAVYLVRAGSEYLILGSAEHGVVPIQRYTEQQARDAGLLDLAEDDSSPGSGPRGGRRSLREVAPGERLALGQTTAGTLLDRLREWTVRR